MCGTYIICTRMGKEKEEIGRWWYHYNDTLLVNLTASKKLLCPLNSRKADVAQLPNTFV
jgi:hypothetical protein